MAIKKYTTHKKAQQTASNKLFSYNFIAFSFAEEYTDFTMSKEEKHHRPCDCPDCKKAGEYRAPKDRSLKSFYWFCLEHVQEYNKSWDYYAGMSPEEIEAHIRFDEVGRRPTWRVNDLYNHRLWDPLGILGQARQKHHRRSKEQVAAIRLLGLSDNFTTSDLKKAYKTLAKKYHPDKTGGDKALEEKFKNLTKAYQLLLKSLS